MQLNYSFNFIVFVQSQSCTSQSCPWRTSSSGQRWRVNLRTVSKELSVWPNRVHYFPSIVQSVTCWCSSFVQVGPCLQMKNLNLKLNNLKKDCDKLCLERGIFGLKMQMNLMRGWPTSYSFVLLSVHPATVRQTPSTSLAMCTLVPSLAGRRNHVQTRLCHVFSLCCGVWGLQFYPN